MKNFEKHKENFERDFNRAKKWTIAIAIAVWSLWFGLIGFGIWAIVMVMRFFEII